MTMSSSLRAAVTEPTSPQARTLLKVLSLGAGAFLVFAGVWGGCMTPIMGGGFVYFVGAVYAVLFGLIVLTVEIKDKTKLITAFYQWIDKYLKFLTLQRGKGAFYLGVGLLVCFMSPSGNSQPALGVNNVAAIILAVVGFLHTCRIIKEAGAPLGSGDAGTAAMQPSSDGIDFSQPIAAPR